MPLERAKEALLPRGAFGGVGSSAFGRRGQFAAAVFEAEAVPVHLQDMDMMSKPVQQCAGEPFGAEDFGPLLEPVVEVIRKAVMPLSGKCYSLISG